MPGSNATHGKHSVIVPDHVLTSARTSGWNSLSQVLCGYWSEKRAIFKTQDSPNSSCLVGMSVGF